MSTVDIVLFSADGYTLSEEVFAPSAATGVDKVAQRFLYYLLTPAGTIPGQPSVGTDFLDSVNTFRSEFDLFAAFAAAEPVAAAAVRVCEDPSDPGDEHYGFARLSSIELNGDSVTMTVLVVAADGSIPAEPVQFTVSP